jgi:catechol 2,3-dioxygenase-like lactoylglutathione lyase family enzyme
MHHVGLRVSSCERAAQFYVEAFDGQLLTRPYLREGPSAAETVSSSDDVRFRCCQVALPGGMVELFEFLEPAAPGRPAVAWTDNIMHFAVQVEDVRRALERVEHAGGRRLWTSVRTLADELSVIYVSDPDHNTIELIDVGRRQLAESISRRRAGASLARGVRR